MRSGGASGSQQTVLMDNVLDCHPLPLQLGAPAAPEHLTMPSVPPAGGEAGLFHSWGHQPTRRIAGKPLAEHSVPSSRNLTGSSEGSVQEAPAQTPSKAVGCADRTGWQVYSRNDAEDTPPRGDRAGRLGRCEDMWPWSQAELIITLRTETCVC